MFDKLKRRREQARDERAAARERARVEREAAFDATISEYLLAGEKIHAKQTGKYFEYIESGTFNPWPLKATGVLVLTDQRLLFIGRALGAASEPFFLQESLRRSVERSFQEHKQHLAEIAGFLPASAVAGEQWFPHGCVGPWLDGTTERARVSFGDKEGRFDSTDSDPILWFLGRAEAMTAGIARGLLRNEP